MARTLLLMIDGISADAFARHAHDLPTLHRLGQNGLNVNRLKSDMPATSLPGRTGILTGLSPKSHGVYGNTIHDGARFRYATPDDVRVPTLPRRATDAGLEAAVLGFGMVRRDDAATFHHPWWVAEMIQRGRDAKPIAAEDGWLRTMPPRDDLGHLERGGLGASLRDLPDPYAGDRTVYLMAGLEGDRRLALHLAALAAVPNGPDLLMGEILIPDSIQHVAGEDHPFSLWSMAYADALVAIMMDRMEQAGTLDDVNVVILSDHGHGAVREALYPERILPNHEAAPEGGTLFVHTPDATSRREAIERLADIGVLPYDTSPFPADTAERLTAFSAPAGAAFERAPEHANPQHQSGVPVYASTHGLRPGTPSDDRFFVAAGPDIIPHQVDVADASDVEATLSTLLGIEVSGTGKSLTKP